MSHVRMTMRLQRRINRGPLLQCITYLFLLEAGWPLRVTAVTLDGIVELERRVLVESSSSSITVGRSKFYAPVATFSLEPTTESGTLRHTPAGNPFLCNNATFNGFKDTPDDGTIFLVPRGNCTFERKAGIAERLYGATGMLLYNTLESRYPWSEAAETMKYPRPMLDYECDNGGMALISNDTFFMGDRYNGTVHDPLLRLDSPTNVCLLPTPQDCDSRRCLVINLTQFACCAWDVPNEMGGDATLPSLERPSDSFVAIFVTMQQGDELIEALETVSDENEFLHVTLSHRSYPRMNASAILLWLFATILTSGASWWSARDYRRMHNKLQNLRFLCTGEIMDIHDPFERLPPRTTGLREFNEQQQQSHQPSVDEERPLGTLQQQDGGQQTRPTEQQEPLDMIDTGVDPPEMDVGGCRSHRQELNQERQDEPFSSRAPHSSPQRGRRSSMCMSLRLWSRTSATVSTRTNTVTNTTTTTVGANPETLEITVWHVVAFVVVASAWLLLLFYFKFYDAVTVLYGIGCAGAVSQVLIKPLLVIAFRVASKLWNGKLLEPDNSNTSSATTTRVDARHWWERPVRRGCLSVVDLLAIALAYSHCAAWIYVFFTVPEPIRNPFYWVSQNVMGACLTISFLQLIRLNSIKVATALMLVVFVYDIFFVFITPYLFDGDSIMVEVATGGGRPESDGVESTICDKYPKWKGCEGNDPLPLLFICPKINDYRGGANLLGLGDVILPGLLLSFGARLDDAKRLIMRHTDLFVANDPKRWFEGFLVPLTMAYAIGLLMALLAVMWMERGQPALLYIVPACLGTLFWVGWREIGDLWKGPIEIMWSDRVVYNVEHERVRLHRDVSRVDDSALSPSR